MNCPYCGKLIKPETGGTEKKQEAVTRFQYYTESPERLVKLLRAYYRDQIEYCSPDMPRDFDGDCTEASLTNCGKCIEKWLEGNMEE